MITEQKLRQVLFVFANVPRIGVSEPGISALLESPVERVEKAVLKLYKRGFLARSQAR